MVLLVSVTGAFHARVLAARLGSDGILTELRGALDGPYPLVGQVDVFVRRSDLPMASELLLADEVESAFTTTDDDGPWAPVVPAWLAVVAILLVTTMWMARGI